MSVKIVKHSEAQWKHDNGNATYTSSSEAVWESVHVAASYKHWSWREPNAMPWFQNKSAPIPIQAEQIKQGPARCVCVLFNVSNTHYKRCVHVVSCLWWYCRCFFFLCCCTVTLPALCLSEVGAKICTSIYIFFFSVNHQRGASGSAGLRRDLDLGSVYRSSISLVPVHPPIVRLMMWWVKPQGRAAPGALHQATEEIPLFPLV